MTIQDKKGEGSYEGALKFQREQHAFVQSGKVEAAAREAAKAIDDSEEAAELEIASQAAANGKIADSER